jgi:hypothetical protein
MILERGAVLTGSSMRPSARVVALTAGLLLVAACANGAGTPARDTSEPGVPPVPPTLVGVRDGTQVVLVDTATGRDLRVLYRYVPWNSGSRIGGLALSPDRTTVYFDAGGALFRVGVDGAASAEHLGSGSHPAISPDGRCLAYDLEDGIVVRSLEQGSERRWWIGSDGPPVFGGSAAWAPDSRHLAFGVGYVEGADGVWTLDTGTDATLADGRRTAPESTFDGLTDFSQSYRAYDGRLGVLEVCCPGPEGTGWISDGATSFAAFDPATGAVDERVELPFRALAATYDASGHHQLFVPIGAGVLWLRSGGTFARIESPGIVLVAW